METNKSAQRVGSTTLMFSKATSLQTSFRLIARSELNPNKDLFINQSISRLVKQLIVILFVVNSFKLEN